MASGKIVFVYSASEGQRCRCSSEAEYYMEEVE